jgi:phage anti-repressor protein
MSVDIVNLIECNPITKLNGNYQSKLVEKVQKTFSNYEQQMFLASFYCYLNYDSKNDFVIDLDNVWKWLGFGQKVNAKRILEKNFVIDKDYKILLCQLAKQTSNTQGGHNKETFMLNVDTFKKICLKAGTKKADEIHDYFIKLEHVLQEVLIEESNKLKIQLEQQKTEFQLLEDKKNQEYDAKLEKQKILEREKILLKEYATAGAIFYIIKVKSFDNGTYIVKVGESRIGVKERYREHKYKYEECLLLDCFAVKKSKDFESFIMDHELIRGSNVNDLIGHEKENELFLIGKKLSYKTLLHTINSNLKYFNNDDTNKLELEIQQLKLMLEMKNNNNDNILIQNLIQSVNNLSSKVNNLENYNKEILSKLNSMQTKTTTNFNQPLVTVGPRLQKINPESMAIVKVYESVAECLKEYNFKVKRPSIDKAIKENTVYNGFRWAFVDRNEDPNILHNIHPTKETKIQNLGYIAKMNKEKTDILNVYIDRKTASSMNGYASSSALDNPVKNFTLTNGYYYILYNKCPEEAITKFEEKINSEPILYKDGIGQYDSQNQLIKEFVCKYDCIKQLKMSDKTLAKALDKNVLYNNFYFKRLGSKIAC